MTDWLTQYPLEADRYAADVTRLAEISFPHGCRFAMTAAFPCTAGHWSNIGCGSPRYAFLPLEEVRLGWRWIILSPGELPPAGEAWTIYEDRGGLPVGRSAHGGRDEDQG